MKYIPYTCTYTHTVDTCTCIIAYIHTYVPTYLHVHTSTVHMKLTGAQSLLNALVSLSVGCRNTSNNAKRYS